MNTSWQRIGFFIVYGATVCVTAALILAAIGGWSVEDWLYVALIPCLGCLSLWSAGLISSQPSLARVGMVAVGVVVVGVFLLFPAIKTAAGR